jgi:hypothetical protein
MTAGMDLDGWVATIDALHTQRETARWLVEDRHGHYLMVIKDNQPHLLAAAQAALSGTDEQFADTTHDTRGRGHGRTEHRRVRTIPASGTDSPTPPSSSGSSAAAAGSTGSTPARRSSTASPASPQQTPAPPPSPPTPAATGPARTRPTTSETSPSPIRPLSRLCRPAPP